MSVNKTIYISYSLSIRTCFTAFLKSPLVLCFRFLFSWGDVKYTSRPISFPRRKVDIRCAQNPLFNYSFLYVCINISLILELLGSFHYCIHIIISRFIFCLVGPDLCYFLHIYRLQKYTNSYISPWSFARSSNTFRCYSFFDLLLLVLLVSLTFTDVLCPDPDVLATASGAVIHSHTCGRDSESIVTPHQCTLVREFPRPKENLVWHFYIFLLHNSFFSILHNLNKNITMPNRKTFRLEIRFVVGQVIFSSLT